MDLISYIEEHVNRGDCICGQCFDRKNDPQQPSGHTVDVCFFRVSAKNDPSADDLKAAISTHRGEFCEITPGDGREHSYLELGGWLGDQGYALMLMGLGQLLGLWELLTPRTVFGEGIPDDLGLEMAAAGYVTIKAAV